MGDGTESKNELTAFLTKLSAPVTVLASITTIYTFAKLFTEKDNNPELLTLISLAVGISVLLGICAYYARFWKPELQDKSASGFTPALDEQVKAQAAKEKQRKLIRRSSVAGLLLIPLLTLGGYAGWQYQVNQPSTDILILVADFEGTDDKNYFVTKTIYENLKTATEPYADVKLKRLNKSLPDTKEAREAGEKQKASIVIWGSYGKTTTTVPISAHFELLKKPDNLPEMAPETQGKVRTMALADLESFKLQTQLSQEMTYLTLVTLGMSRYAASDWDGAIARFSDALHQLPGPTATFKLTAPFFYRGFAYYYKEAYDQAIKDYYKAIELDPKLDPAYYKRGNVYANKKNDDLAIKDYAKAIELDPKSAHAYYNRGLTYDDKQNYDLAIKDYTKAIELDPKYPTAYYNRGLAYGHKKDYDLAIKNYDKAIELDPKFAFAYVARGFAYEDKKNYDQAIKDYDKAIQLDSKNAAAYGNRGEVYRDQGNEPAAIKDFQKVLELTTNPDDRKDAEQELKKLGVK